MPTKKSLSNQKASMAGIALLQFAATIAVDDDKIFEAAALEEYLIAKLQPKENSLHKWK